MRRFNFFRCRRTIFKSFLSSHGIKQDLLIAPYLSDSIVQYVQIKVHFAPESQTIQTWTNLLQCKNTCTSYSMFSCLILPDVTSIPQSIHLRQKNVSSTHRMKPKQGNSIFLPFSLFLIASSFLPSFFFIPLLSSFHLFSFCLLRFFVSFRLCVRPPHSSTSDEGAPLSLSPPEQSSSAGAEGAVKPPGQVSHGSLLHQPS